ncbi:MAG TPA: DUF4873 domain-containing protein [Marmoricola sp.]
MSTTSRAGDLPPEEYDGPAEILLDQGSIGVTVTLRGRFEPIDGRFHWWGRVHRCPALDDAVRSGAVVALRTPHGSADGRLSDVDPWGRFRISGNGRPPF